MASKRKSTPILEVESVSPKPILPRRISMDLGNAYGNLIADGGIQADWRSVQGLISDAKQLKDLPFDDVLKIGGVWYVFGEASYTYAPRSLEDFTVTNRYTSQWYRRLFSYALHRVYGLRLQEGPFSPRVVLSIPASQYTNDSTVSKVRKNIVGPYVMETTLPGACLQVEITSDNLTIIPEGAGSFIEASATNKNMERGLWLVVDIGYLTTDVIAFHDGDYVPDLAASDTSGGMGQIANAVARHIAAETGAELRPADIDPDLRCSAITVNSQPVEIETVRNQALDKLGERIARFVFQATAGQNLTGILLTGGGAELLHNRILIPGLPQITTAQNPRRANALGGYKLIAE